MQIPHRAPYIGSHLSWAYPAVTAYVLYLTLSCLIRTAYTDPGIVPRASEREARQLGYHGNRRPHLMMHAPGREYELQAASRTVEDSVVAVAHEESCLERRQRQARERQHVGVCVDISITAPV